MSQTPTSDRSEPTAQGDAPPYRYTAALAAEIESRWQDRWEARGHLRGAQPGRADGRARARSPARPKKYVLDMFPYPSGIGLHVGHPLGYIATDVYGRFKRMTGHNVLHALGYDAFGLPAEQYAVQTGQHPRVTTEANIATMRRQLRRLGLAPRPAPQRRDHRRGLLPVDAVDLPADLQRLVRRRGAAGPGRSTSWSPSWRRRARARAGPTAGPPWADLDEVERRAVVDAHRLAYLSESPVNWCPGLGTVLANEEVTADGRSDRGNFPVFKRNLRQWMMRITAYADRLLADLDGLDWPEPIKLHAAQLDRALRGRAGRASRRRRRRDRGLHHPARHAVRRDLHGAGARAPAGRRADRRRLAGRHRPAWTGGAATPRDAVAAYRRQAARQDRPGAADRGPRQDRRLHRRLRDQPGQRRARSRSSSPTTC